MGNYLNIGNAGFAGATKGIYVDKTEMISFINSTLGTLNKLTCVSRPRRFGKSLAAKMLCAYYDKSCDSKKLFEGLAISKDSSFEKYLNKYNTIYLDITLFISRAVNVKDVVKNISDAVIAEISEGFSNVPAKADLAETLVNVSKASGEKFIMIIDEWDALFREAKDDAMLQKEYIDLLRSLFKSSWTDDIFEAAYMTGILPIKKYGNQSAVSDFREYTMLSPGPLAKYMGFTELEVKSLCKQYGMDFEEMKHWYDGYSFSRLKSVYSPNSVMEAIVRAEYGSYWVGTESYESLKVYIDMDFGGLKESIIQMLGGEKVNIITRTFKNDMINIESKDDVLTLLVHLGYLAYDAKEKVVFIPNEEVRQEFVTTVTGGRHNELIKLVQNSNRLFEQTLSMNEKAVENAIENAHKIVSSPISYNKEDSLRSTIRFAYITHIDEFIEVDEFPSGTGYADMVFMPKAGSKMPVIVVELKWNKTAESAIAQIKNKDYPHAFESYGGDIYLVAINYDTDTKKHTCKIEKYIKN
ncbi:MAG: ATP-binding protein [Clostridium sp.]|nr:ATP-binding protein [Clostridium sp.]